MKILCVHGIGHADLDPNYYQPWQTAISDGLRACGLKEPLEFKGFRYDDLFQDHYHGPGTYAAALSEFLATAAVHSVTDPLSETLHPSRAFFNPFDQLRWRPGMVAQLAVEPDLRKDLCSRLLDLIDSVAPDILAAHSLGTLIAYDLLHNDPRGANILKGATFLTFGSQINNPFARSRLFPGRITVPNVRFWFHLFNRLDPVLTAPIPIADDKFLQVLTESRSGHSAITTPLGPGYLDHPKTRSDVWTPLALPASQRKVSRSFEIINKATAKPRRRALLIGINNYPDAENHLDGCVNDVFLVSALLQERGFAAEDIRVVLDERATAQAIRDRLAWLLEGADDGMERVLFYSGHGAQLPGYNAAEKIDHVNECLVPYDFAWTKETAISDDDFYQLYSDLPFVPGSPRKSAHFFAVFDCCHSGGMTRDGSRKVRGITPPDDIRHRMLKWDKGEQMWRQRELPPLNDDFGGTVAEKQVYMGRNLATLRLGRAMRLRKLDRNDYSKLPKGDRGPYLPVLLEACKEGELSFEYRHGVTSYGAFTYSFAKNLRNNPQDSFKKAVNRTNKTLHSLGFDQTAQLVGPDRVLSKRIPGN